MNGAYELAALLLAIREIQGPSLPDSKPMLSEISHSIHVYEESLRDHADGELEIINHHVRWG